jgi:3-phytase
VRDAEAQLYLVEEGLGLWQLAVDPEREGRRLLLQDAQADAKTLRQWLAAHPEAPPERLPELPATAQTDPVARQGDAADDPAIWVHPRNGARSRILATNKKQGLLVYDLKGRQTQLLEVGRVNNVDLRQGLNYAGQRWDLAVATQRDEAALVLFGIDPAGRVRELARLPTGLDDIYGVCSLRNAAGRLRGHRQRQGRPPAPVRSDARTGPLAGRAAARVPPQQPARRLRGGRGQRLAVRGRGRPGCVAA